MKETNNKNIFKRFQNFCDNEIEGGFKGVIPLILVGLLFIVLIIVVTLLITKSTDESTTYITYEISAFYRVSEDRFCVYMPTDDGGIQVVDFSNYNMTIYPARGDSDEIEVEINTREFQMEENSLGWQSVKVYTSKTPDEIERIKPIQNKEDYD
jgi:hypothetical protein